MAFEGLAGLALFLGVPVTTLIILLILIVIWDGVWKLIALWKSARRNQLVWFIILAIINSAGILPIVYLAFFQKKRKR